MRSDFELRSEVQQEIHEALEGIGWRDAEKIWVEASDGIVVLKGMVKDRNEREQAAQVAWSTKGVRAVYNDIRVAA